MGESAIAAERDDRVLLGRAFKKKKRVRVPAALLEAKKRAARELAGLRRLRRLKRRRLELLEKLERIEEEISLVRRRALTPKERVEDIVGRPPRTITEAEREERLLTEGGEFLEEDDED